MRWYVLVFALTNFVTGAAVAAGPEWLTYCPDLNPPQSQSTKFYDQISYSASDKRIRIAVKQRLKSVQYTCSALEPCDARLAWQATSPSAPNGPGTYLLVTSGNEIGFW